MRKPIFEILNEANSKRAKKKRAEVLQENSSKELKQVLSYFFDQNIQFQLPPGVPPYNANNEGMDNARFIFYKEAKKMGYFHKLGESPLIPNELKREQRFIFLLETVHPKDAEWLVLAKDRINPFKNITWEVVETAFPGLKDKWNVSES